MIIDIVFILIIIAWYMCVPVLHSKLSGYVSCAMHCIRPIILLQCSEQRQQDTDCWWLCEMYYFGNFVYLLTLFKQRVFCTVMVGCPRLVCFAACFVPVYFVSQSRFNECSCCCNYEKYFVYGMPRINILQSSKTLSLAYKMPTYNKIILIC